MYTEFIAAALEAQGYVHGIEHRFVGSSGLTLSDSLAAAVSRKSV